MAKSAVVSVVKDPELGRRLRVNVASRKGFSDIEAKRHQSAAELAEIVINSFEFKRMVTGRQSFTSTDDTGVQVYNRLMTGAEVLDPAVDYEMDVNVTIYEQNNSTVGYTYSNVVMIWLNRKFFKKYSLGEIAGNMVHEWTHKMGYGHTSNNTSVRPYSVPYWIGYLVRDMVQDYEDGERFTDLYPIVIEVPTVPENPEVTEPVVVAPAPEKKKICKWTWRFWLGKVCYYE